MDAHQTESYAPFQIYVTVDARTPALIIHNRRFPSKSKCFESTHIFPISPSYKISYNPLPLPPSLPHFLISPFPTKLKPLPPPLDNTPINLPPTLNHLLTRPRHPLPFSTLSSQPTTPSPTYLQQQPTPSPKLSLAVKDTNTPPPTPAP